MRSPVYLLGALAEVSDERGMFAGDRREVCLFGLFDVLEFHPVEPSAYVHSPCFTVAPMGVDDGVTYSIDAHEYDRQVNPREYGRELVQERRMVFAAEENWR